MQRGFPRKQHWKFFTFPVSYTFVKPNNLTLFQVLYGDKVLLRTSKRCSEIMTIFVFKRRAAFAFKNYLTRIVMYLFICFSEMAEKMVRPVRRRGADVFCGRTRECHCKHRLSKTSVQYIRCTRPIESLWATFARGTRCAVEIHFDKSVYPSVPVRFHLTKVIISSENVQAVRTLR